jgi:hypothetical protein
MNPALNAFYVWILLKDAVVEAVTNYECRYCGLQFSFEAFVVVMLNTGQAECRTATETVSFSEVIVLQ